MSDLTEMEDTRTRKTYVILNELTDVHRMNPADGNGQLSQAILNGQANAVFIYRFPEEFINSTRPRSIEVHHCKVAHPLNQNHQNIAANDIILHADFIKRDTYLDHSVMVCNETRTKYKKYAYTSPDQYFKIWFTSFTVPGFTFQYNAIHFFLELMLIY